MAELTQIKHFTLQSIIDTSVVANGIIDITSMSGDHILGELTIKYNDTSTFRPGMVKTFAINGVKDPATKKIILSSSVRFVDQQISIAIMLNGVFPVAYYSTIFPIDCGTIKLREQISSLKAVFQI